MDKNDILNEIKETLDFIESRYQSSSQKNKVSQNTAKEYEQITKRVFAKYKNESQIANYLSSLSSVTYARKIRASLLSFFCSKVQAILDKLSKNPDEDIDRILRELNYLHRNLVSISEAKLLDIDSNQRKKKKSKKDNLRFLTRDWREQILNRMPNYQLEILTLAIAGCRPSELKTGVEWRLENDILIAKINGVKVTNYSGQQQRELKFAINNPLTLKLKEHLIENNKYLKVINENPARLTGAVRSAGIRAFGKSKNKVVTCYSFRHQFASDTKQQISQGKTLVDDTDLSIALGHFSEETSKYYGHAKKSKSSGDQSLLAVTGSRKVKPKKQFDLNLIKSKIQTKV